MLAGRCGAAIGAVVPSTSQAQQHIDVVAWFEKVSAQTGAGLARKTKPVDARPAKSGEVVVTVIKGEGKETQSPPAKPGDMVVRNRCEPTGNEEILVKSETFAKRYQGPIGRWAAHGWRAYQPRGVAMRFVIVREGDGTFTFDAPWGERMIARAGDAIVQDPKRPKDTYRIAKAAFDCTYEVVKPPAKP